MILFGSKSIFAANVAQELTPRYARMTKVKETSTRQHNKAKRKITCPLTYAVNKIAGHWKLIIIKELRGGPLRYYALRKSMPNISEKVLIQQLKQLQTDEIVIRRAVEVIPPEVSYELSDSGKELTEVWDVMAAWGRRESKRQNDKEHTMG
ncbi:DNA-binding HxlR family transcriptional regulator [Mucilaginibacter sp. SG538B]|uniref:winged helix-turn-helix transcriptional regulator n=1 Tax=Mucilaginibacter sp. SG538B TaxID=2587021 RepID=UPI00181FBD03|nr:helix-turn-helix domain-containing protein [Mucilaginibacter sp. SG538B]NVM66655.1 DNA-binding HxlR family transcriptional regulator [Mucilaginibacter sp. SG538B]